MEREIISFDYAIKNILRDKANFDILSGFLTELLEKPVIVDEILESEGNTDTSEGKINRLDLKAKIDNGELAVFEIQFFDQIDFLGKVLFNACKAVVEQVSGGELFDIKKVYSVNIVRWVHSAPVHGKNTINRTGMFNPVLFFLFPSEYISGVLL